MSCRCHSDPNLYGSLRDCPACGHSSLEVFGAWEGCERRVCGYERKEEDMALCKSCCSVIDWVSVDGKPHPIDTGQFPVKPGHLVVNPVTYGARFLKAENLEQATNWIAAGAEVRRSHFASCPNAAQHRQMKIGGQS